MGGIVLTHRSVLIAGLQGTGSTNKTGHIVFRVALALCLGAFMAQPALLIYLKKDIDIQLTFDREVGKQATVAESSVLWLLEVDPLIQQRDSLAAIKARLRQTDCCPQDFVSC